MAYLPRPMSVDKLQEAEEQVAQMREEAARDEQDALREDLRRPPLDETAAKAHRPITAPLAHVRTMTNMRGGPLEDIHELPVSIRETGSCIRRWCARRARMSSRTSCSPASGGSRR